MLPSGAREGKLVFMAGQVFLVKAQCILGEREWGKEAQVGREKFCI